MKSNLLWVWCLINTILITLCFMTVGLDSNYDTIQDDKISDLDNKIETIQYYIDHKSADTIIVNNYVKFFDKTFKK